MVDNSEGTAYESVHTKVAGRQQLAARPTHLRTLNDMLHLLALWVVLIQNQLISSLLLAPLPALMNQIPSGEKEPGAKNEEEIHNVTFLPSGVRR